jgi:hypothetical protein
MKIRKVSKRDNVITEKKKKRKWIPIISLFIIIVMVGSSLVLMKNKEDNYNYNGFSITKTENGWLLSKGQGSLLFIYDPKSLENIKIENINIGNKVYTIIDNNSVQEIDILKTYLRNLGFSVNDACFSEENCPDVPIVSCNSTVPVLYFKEGNISISKQDNCIRLNSNKEDKLKIINVLIYKILGVL